MVKRILLTLILLPWLAACGTSQANELDTSGLQKDFTSSNTVKYEAPSLEAALDAVPFKITLPEKLPFESEGFKPKKLKKRKGDTDSVILELVAESSKDREAVLRLYAGNGDYLVHQNELGGEPLKLKDGTPAFYLYVQPYHVVKFEKNGIEYSVNYSHTEKSTDLQKQDLLNIANQLNAN
ncbi:hypothetical protein [Bacillus marinisedimentorum]|uniref:hypothetical protein n=1 Tax=Bacillus marinisedimentorum TaxID=1821260 RepID=UPI0007E0505F|nr:hypothetical protein [Bacillus marinisedimentorum]